MIRLFFQVIGCIQYDEWVQEFIKYLKWGESLETRRRDTEKRLIDIGV